MIDDPGSESRFGKSSVQNVGVASKRVFDDESSMDNSRRDNKEIKHKRQR